MLLNIYLGTIAISGATVFIHSDACAKKLKREGYQVAKDERALPKKIVNCIRAAFLISMPVYNILNTIVIIGMGDNLYEHMKNSLLEQGKIYEPISAELNNDCGSQILNKDDDDKRVNLVPAKCPVPAGLNNDYESQILHEDDDDKIVNLVPAKCPSCGAQLELDDNMKRAECSFCNTKIIVKTDTNATSVQKKGTEKTYDEMTTEEKQDYLQQEKEKLINQETSQVEHPFILSKRRKQCQKY